MNSYELVGSSLGAILFTYLLLLSCLLRDRGKDFDAFEEPFLDLNFDVTDYVKIGNKLQLSDDWEWRFEQRNGQDDLLACDDLFTLALDSEFVSAGWTKTVSKSRLDGRSLAVKSVHLEGRHFADCLRKGASYAQCYKESAGKVLKEIALLYHLKHPNIVELLGYCIPRNPYALPENDSPLRISIITEFGQQADLIEFLQLDWEERLKRLHSISKLLLYLSKSPFGSAAVGDFRRQQFVLDSGGQLKIVDIDDFAFTEPTCGLNSDCCQRILTDFGQNCSQTLNVPCRGGRCERWNELHNLYHTNKVFFGELLSHGIPEQLRPDGQVLLEKITKLSLSSEQLHKEIELLAVKHRAAHIEPSFDQNPYFSVVPHSDLPSSSDYSCRGSRSHVSCTLSVGSLPEAQRLCLAQSSCAALVWSPDRSWTGRPIVHFKNNNSAPFYSPNSLLYIRI